MKYNIYIIVSILLSLIFLCISNTINSVDNFEILKDIIINNNLVINKSLITGQKNYKYPTHNVDIAGTHFSDKLCVNNHYNENCLNVNDYKSIKEMPHYYPKKLRVGSVVLDEQDFKNLKNIDATIQKYYETPVKNATYLAKPQVINSNSSKPAARISIPGDRNIWDDFWFYNQQIGSKNFLTRLDAKTLNYPWPPPSGGGGGCLGSHCLLQTSNGMKELKNIKVGEKLLSFNTKTNKISYETIYYIRSHDDLPIINYKIFLGSDLVIMSPDHLVLLKDDKCRRADSLIIGDKIKNIVDGYSIVTDIQYVYDIPLTPVVLNGTIVLPNNSIISCWTKDQNNIDKMQILMELTRPYTFKFTPDEVASMMHTIYNYFNSESKDTTKLDTIMKNSGIPLLKN